MVGGTSSSVMPPLVPVQANELLEKLESLGVTREHLQTLVNNVPWREVFIRQADAYMPGGKHRATT